MPEIPPSSQRLWHQVWPMHVGKSLEYPDEPAWWLLTHNLPRLAQRVAIRHLDHETGAEISTLTYGDLVDQARHLAAGLQAHGIIPGDRVAMYLPNAPELVVAYYGIWMAGAVGVPCNPMYKEAELEHQLADSGARLLITGPELYPVARRVAPTVGVPVAVAPVAGERMPELGTGDFAWSRLLASGRLEHPVRPANLAEDLALLIYTGGTTGLPKGAMLTHRNLVVNGIQFCRWYDMEEGNEISISVLPMCHSGGMSGAMNVPLMAGATLLLFKRFNADVVLRTIERYRATRFTGVPTMFAGILNTEDFGRCDLSSLRACRTGAAPLPGAVKAAIDAHVGREVLVEGYGLTETSPLTHANPVGRSRLGSIGIPISDTDACILDGDGNYVCEPDVEGELCLRGPQVMRGYWNRPDETAAALADGWFHTGDIARMDEEGYFYVVDRMKDMINAAGFKVWPREVEEVLYHHPAVQMAAVVGVPDDYRGESVKAFVVLKNEVTPAEVEADILRHCRQELANYKVPRHIEFCAELPLSGAGKVLRRMLREVQKS